MQKYKQVAKIFGTAAAFAAALIIGAVNAKAEPLNLFEFTTVDYTKSGPTANGPCRVVVRRSDKPHDIEKVCPLRAAPKPAPKKQEPARGATWWGM